MGAVAGSLCGQCVHDRVGGARADTGGRRVGRRVQYRGGGAVAGRPRADADDDEGRAGRAGGYHRRLDLWV